jgi:hypothetical protein
MAQHILSTGSSDVFTCAMTGAPTDQIDGVGLHIVAAAAGVAQAMAQMRTLLGVGM